MGINCGDHGSEWHFRGVNSTVYVSEVILLLMANSNANLGHIRHLRAGFTVEGIGDRIKLQVIYLWGYDLCLMGMGHLFFIESQRAMVAARVKAIYEMDARERQIEAGKKYGRGQEKLMDNCPQVKGTARDKVGEAMNVSGRSIQRAEKVISKGIPESVFKRENSTKATQI